MEDFPEDRADHCQEDPGQRLDQILAELIHRCHVGLRDDLLRSEVSTEAAEKGQRGDEKGEKGLAVHGVCVVAAVVSRPMCNHLNTPPKKPYRT